MPLAELADATLFYEQRPSEAQGDGPPLLLIGGTGSDLRQQPSPFAWPGAERFSLLAYEHRDLGRSRSRSQTQPTMADFAQDALSLADHVGWERFSVLGISFGGMVAQELALAAQARIDRLALVVTSAGGVLGSSFPLHELYSLSPSARAAELVKLLDTRAEHEPALAAALESYFAQDRGFATREAAPAGLLRQLEARRHHDTAARLAQLRIPTLVVGGRFDGIAPPERSLKLAQAIPGACVALFNGGHGLLVQDPAAWPMIAAFLHFAAA